MAWINIVTLENIKNSLGITDNSQDAILNDSLLSLIRAIENITGIDFNFTNNTVSEIFINTPDTVNFVLNTKILQCGAWQSITSVEISSVNLSTYTNWVLNSDYILDYFKTKPKPIKLIRPFGRCSRFNLYDKVRITGIKGFGSEFVLPDDLYGVFLLAIGELYGYYYKVSENDFNTAQVESEKDLTTSVSYSNILTPNEIQKLKLMDLRNIPSIMSKLRNYICFQHYPY